MQNVTAVAFHPELPLLLTGSEDGTVRVWHAATFRLETTLNYGLERVWSLACQKGNNHVAIGYDEGADPPCPYIPSLLCTVTRGLMCKYCIQLYCTLIHRQCNRENGPRGARHFDGRDRQNRVGQTRGDSTGEREDAHVDRLV